MSGILYSAAVECRSAGNNSASSVTPTSNSKMGHLNASELFLGCLTQVGGKHGDRRITLIAKYITLFY